MKTLRSCIIVALLAGCGASQLPIVSPGAAPQLVFSLASKTNYQVIYNFKYPGTDGVSPQSDLTAHRAKLYGTTAAGGEYGRGTVFEVDPAGREHTTHSFTGGDGEQPMSAVTFVNDALYGTTPTGGRCAPGCGTLYKIENGIFSVVFGFDNFAGGENPYGALTSAGGALYGTTYDGGNGICYYGCGVVFTLNVGTSQVTTVHEFDQKDGNNPEGRLIFFEGAFYGTTYRGGHETGVVYKMAPSGREHRLYRFRRGFKRDFGRGKDGWGPIAGLTAMNGVLYGTTAEGGTGTACGVNGCGTVYSITGTGRERVIHSFQSGTDGATPYGDLVALHGKLYGTTRNGGSDCSSNGCGVIFSIDAAGNESVLHAFRGTPDGQWPEAGLTALDGKVYGTTSAGGTDDAGTVFSLTP
jgi:uncharacterized repeat protein (TIGR03803 family)